MTDWTLTEPLMEQIIKDAVSRNPKINEESLRETLTEFHNIQRFEFSGKKISPRMGKWGAYTVVDVQDNRILIREFYEGFEEFAETNPQKLLDEFSRPIDDGEGPVVTIWHTDVPLFTGIEFVDNQRIRISDFLISEEIAMAHFLEPQRGGRIPAPRNARGQTV